MEAKYLPDYNHLIKQLESLDFERRDNRVNYKYIREYNNFIYVFKFFKDVESFPYKQGFVICKKMINVDDESNSNITNFIIALDYLNTEFRHVLRKRKIESIL